MKKYWKQLVASIIVASAVTAIDWLLPVNFGPAIPFLIGYVTGHYLWPITVPTGTEMRKAVDKAKSQGLI